MVSAALGNNPSNAQVQAALVALPGIGAGGVVVTGGPPSFTITWQVPILAALLVVAVNLLTNGGVPVSSPTITNTTPGISPAPLGKKKGGLVQDTTNGNLYQNTGTAAVPIWTQIS